MKAIIIEKFGGPEVMEIGEAPVPTPGFKEVQIEVAYSALNRADTLQRQGFYPPPAGASEILGLEVSGIISEVGEAVSKWKIGDRVCALLSGGGYAEKAVVDESSVMHIPAQTSLRDAAGLPEVFLTSYQALHYLGELKKGEKVLIHAGASGVGTAAIQMAKKIGAEVYVTASKTKHQICKDLGADHVINYREENFGEILRSQMNLVIDFIGALYFEKNISALAPDGRMVMLAFLGGTQVSETNLAPILRKRLKIMGSTLRARSNAYKGQLIADFQKDYMAFIDSGEIKPVIDSEFDLENVVEAHERMESNQNKGKILLKVS